MTDFEADPFWTAEIYNDRSGEDFLAVRAVQENLTGFLLPGVITITPRARYYAFYCWVFREYFEDHPSGWRIGRFIRRREQIFGLANVAYEASVGMRTSGLIGAIKFRRHRAACGEATHWPLKVDNYLSRGRTGYSANYAGVMNNLRLVQYDDDQQRYELLPKGVRLAEAYAKTVGDTTYYQNRHGFDEAEDIPKAVLLEYGEYCYLDKMHNTLEATATIDALFALDAPIPTSTGGNGLGNMKATLSVILDLARQSNRPLNDTHFRCSVAYGICPDFSAYQPHPALAPILAHWRMFALRDLYIYALYALWTLFLRWLENEGAPRRLAEFHRWLEDEIDLAEPAAALGLSLPSRSLAEWRFSDLLNEIAEQNSVPAGDLPTLGSLLINRYAMKPNEYKALALINSKNLNSPNKYVGGCWFLLLSLALRIVSLPPEAPDMDWVRQGGWDRRAISHFLQRLQAAHAQDMTIGAVWEMIFREFVIAQHVRAALQKWRQRGANTFHFTVEDGLFEFRRRGGTGWSASRFTQTYQVLTDLGLLDAKAEPEETLLTTAGDRVLSDALERLCNDA